MKLLIAASCFECNKMAVQLLSRDVTEEDKNKIQASIGDMFCVRSEVFDVELDKEPITMERV